MNFCLNASRLKALRCWRWMAIGLAAITLNPDIVYGRKVITIEKTPSAMPVVIQPVVGDNGQDWHTIVANDLSSTGSFRVMAPEMVAGLSMDQWRQQHSGQSLLWVTAGVVGQEGHQARIRVQMWQVADGSMQLDRVLMVPLKDQRLPAHMVANAIYERVTGYPGDFHTQIFFTQEIGPSTAMKRRVAVVDQDGANARCLTPADQQTSVARVHPRQKLMVYTVREPWGNRYTVLHNWNSGTKNLVQLPGQATIFSSRFTPDGQRLIMSAGQGATTGLFEQDITNGQTRTLSYNSWAIEVSPSYGPDGRSFVFASDRHASNSNRTGSPKLYIMDSSTGTPRLLSQQAGSYFAPVWSPDGKHVAFVRRYKGVYYLGVVPVQGGAERMLAYNHMIDMPSWSPNSCSVVFASQERRFGPFSLYKVSLNGLKMVKIPLTTGANYPEWSPWRMDGLVD